MNGREPEPAAAKEAEGEAPALELSGVTAGSLFDSARARVTGLDWSVRAGEFWVVGGLLGAGKTDLMVMMAGLVPPVEGEIKVFGRDYEHGFAIEEDGRRPVGLVFDGGQLLHHLTLWDNIALPVQYHRNCRVEECRETVDRVLDYTGMTPWANKRPGEISRNWRQRAGLARALALPPRLLLLDSPLSGMDPSHARWWLRTSADLARGHEVTGGRPLTLVATAHDLRPWTAVANRFAILKQGRFKAGAPERSAAEQAAVLAEEMFGGEEGGF